MRCVVVGSVASCPPASSSSPGSPSWQADTLLLGDLLGVASEVFVLFGDRVPSDPVHWHPGDPRYDDLHAGDGRLLAEQIAEQLGAVIVPT